MKTKDRTKVQFSYRTNSYHLAESVDWGKIVDESQKLQSKFRQEDACRAEVNYERLIAIVSGERWEIVGTCPCGKHKGIRFWSGDRLLSEEALCPVSVYLVWQRKAMRDGCCSRFLQEKPIGAFLQMFRLMHEGELRCQKTPAG